MAKIQITKEEWLRLLDTFSTMTPAGKLAVLCRLLEGVPVREIKRKKSIYE